MGRKHCGKRQNCSFRAIPPFPQCFQKNLYNRHLKPGLVWKSVKTLNCVVQAPTIHFVKIISLFQGRPTKLNLMVWILTQKYYCIRERKSRTVMHRCNPISIYSLQKCISRSPYVDFFSSSFCYFAQQF